MLRKWQALLLESFMWVFLISHQIAKVICGAKHLNLDTVMLFYWSLKQSPLAPFIAKVSNSHNFTVKPVLPHHTLKAHGI